MRPGGVVRVDDGRSVPPGRARLADGGIALDLDGIRENAGVMERAEHRCGCAVKPGVSACRRMRRNGRGRRGRRRLVAPIPGQVTQILAEPGRQVARGETLVMLEAMKTVFRLAAPADAVVDGMACRAGDAVQEGQLLVRFVDQPEASL